MKLWLKASPLNLPADTTKMLLFDLWAENPKNPGPCRYYRMQTLSEHDLRDLGFTRKLPKGDKVFTVELTLK
jgi:hypothetical protein